MLAAMIAPGFALSVTAEPPFPQLPPLPTGRRMNTERAKEILRMINLHEPLRLNLRLNRAEQLIAAVMSAVCPHLSEEHDAARDVYYALVDMFTRDGIEVLSDYDRQAAGLPPRGPDGWTMEEIVELEKRRLEALARPVFMPTFIPKDDKNRLVSSFGFITGKP